MMLASACANEHASCSTPRRKIATSNSCPGTPIERFREADSASLQSKLQSACRINKNRRPPMPLPSDEKILALSNDILQTFDSIFGQHPGFRPAHAKGAMLTGTFTPSSDGASLTRAGHMNNPSTPVSVRFSNSTGVPLIPDNDANANPRGLAIRFHL